MSEPECQRHGCEGVLLDDKGKCPRCGYDYAAPLPPEIRAVMGEVLAGLAGVKVVRRRRPKAAA